MTLKEFKTNLIGERFFLVKKVDADGIFLFEENDSYKAIENTELYKTIIKIADNEKSELYKAILTAYRNNSKINKFKRDFIKNLLKDAKTLNYDVTKIKEDYETILKEYVFLYTDEQVVEKYVISDINELFTFDTTETKKCYEILTNIENKEKHILNPFHKTKYKNTKAIIFNNVSTELYVKPTILSIYKDKLAKVLNNNLDKTKKEDKKENKSPKKEDKKPATSGKNNKTKKNIIQVRSVKSTEKIWYDTEEYKYSKELAKFNYALLMDLNTYLSTNYKQNLKDILTVEFSKKHESFRSKAYKDTKGILTIGYGFNIDSGNKTFTKAQKDNWIKNGITKEEATVIAQKLYSDFEKGIANKEWYKIHDPVRKGVLCDLVYNMGLAKYEGQFKNMIAALIAKDYWRAGYELLNSGYARQTFGRAVENFEMLTFYNREEVQLKKAGGNISDFNSSSNSGSLSSKPTSTKKNPAGIFNKINKKMDINVDSKNKKININDIYKSTIFLKQLLNKYYDKYKEHNTNKYFILTDKIRKEFIDLASKNNDLRKNLEVCKNKLLELKEEAGEVAGIIDEYKELPIKNETELVLSYFTSYCDAYDAMCKNEFAKTDLMINGKISESNEFLINNEQSKNSFVDSFLFRKPKSEREENDSKSNFPFAVLFDKNNFLELKELDYRNLEASLMNGNFASPNKMDCRRMWIILYFILAFLGHKKTYYTNIDPKDFLSMIKKFFENIKKEDWNNNYSDEEKTFACLYPFVRYRNNPFTGTMLDKGFDKSQEQARKLREYVESKQEEFIDSVKEYVYGENKIYDIIQSIADIAAELSTPISLYSDFDVEAEGGNAVGGFLNACVSSSEMQTAMLLYDFLFNIQITINGKDYSLNDLNNMIKTFNLILEYSKTENELSRNYFREDLVKDSTFYRNCRNRGFYTYLKSDLEKKDEITSYIKDFIGEYFLEDETFAFNVVEYLVHKEPSCSRGDISELSSRFVQLNFYEWLSIYAAYRLRTVDKKFIDAFPDSKLFDYNLGYVFIKNFVNSCVLESKNDNGEINFLDPYLENISNDVLKDDKEFMKFKQLQAEAFIRFKRNLLKNEKTCISAIAKLLSDDKIYDWLMKMMPSYQLIAGAFGFSTLDSLSTLDEFLKGLVINVNVLIKNIFDKWKVETIETLKVRRFTFLDKENYYYIQAFPVMIDWLVRNLEVYITSCTETFYDSGIDYNKEMSNEERFEKISKDFLILLKEEVAILSPTQLEKFKEEFRKVVLSVTDIDKEKAEKLLDDILFINYIKDVSKLDKLFEFLTPKQTIEVMEKLEELNK